jgi:hypothetical protein
LSRKVTAVQSAAVAPAQLQRLLDGLAALTGQYDRSLTAAQADIAGAHAQLATAARWGCSLGHSERATDTKI